LRTGQVSGVGQAAHERIKRDPAFHRLGTLRDVIGIQLPRSFPPLMRSGLPLTARIGSPDLFTDDRIWLRHTACQGCVTAAARSARFAGAVQGTVAENIEYESLALMGESGYRQPGRIGLRCHLCDLYGLDTMSAAALLGLPSKRFSVEIFRRPNSTGWTFALGL